MGLNLHLSHTLTLNNIKENVYGMLLFSYPVAVLFVNTAQEALHTQHAGWVGRTISEEELKYDSQTNLSWATEKMHLTAFLLWCGIKYKECEADVTTYVAVGQPSWEDHASLLLLF